ncbi:hypothetical protein ACHAWO_000685 [Cyclotella atomus]|uniref:Hexosyltransferase n=1 Tax=Cyclotella atomus TaxID=382360 RepID=A0ABD3NY26_9STRA
MARSKTIRYAIWATTVLIGLRHISQTSTNHTHTIEIIPIKLDHPDQIAKRRNSTLYPPPKDHPFAGARDANGHWGYVADPYSLRNHMLHRYRTEMGNLHATMEDMLDARYMPLMDREDVNETKEVCDTAPGEGIEGIEGWDVLVNKILVGGGVPMPNNAQDPREPPNGWGLGLHPAIDDPPYFNSPKPPKVFCGMYTYHKKHYLLEGAIHSWAYRCDGFLAFSDVTDPSIGAVDLPHYGAESYNNMWQKVRSIWCYIYMNYYDQFDYFHLGGDDTMMIVDNLRNYLWSLDDEYGTKPLYIGGPYKTRGVVVCGGGPGYTLNRVTLKWLVTVAFAKPDNTEDSGEDRLMGFTLREFVRCYDTHDANGGMRYLGWQPKHYGKSCDEMPCSNNMAMQFRWWQKYVNKNVSGIVMVSSQAVSFHLLRNAIMLKRIHAILYKACPKNTALGDATI